MTAKLTLGPLLFNWEPDAWRDFYARIADEAPIDRVYLGEVVCSKRQPFTAPLMDEVIDRLRSAGKEVVVSTLALVMNRREARQLGELIEGMDCLVEANDVSALAGLQGRPHRIGPFVNVYNEATLDWCKGNGAVGVCLPPELPRSSIAALAARPDVEIEVQVFGRVPLALSARCYHARVHGLTKDGCQFVCGKDTDGLDVETLDGEPFLAINGIQTMSHRCLNLLPELADLRAIGVSAVRLSPHSCDMVAVAAAYRAVLDNVLSPDEAERRLREAGMDLPFSNGFYHAQPGAVRRMDVGLGSIAGRLRVGR